MKSRSSHDSLPRMRFLFFSFDFVSTKFNKKQNKVWGCEKQMFTAVTGWSSLSGPSRNTHTQTHARAHNKKPRNKRWIARWGAKKKTVLIETGLLGVHTNSNVDGKGMTSTSGTTRLLIREEYLSYLLAMGELLLLCQQALRRRSLFNYSTKKRRKNGEGGPGLRKKKKFFLGFFLCLLVHLPLYETIANQKINSGKNKKIIIFTTSRALAILGPQWKSAQSKNKCFLGWCSIKKKKTR